MVNAAITTTIGKLRSVYTKEQFTKACHDYVHDDCRLPVDESNDASWNDCYDFLSKNLPTDAAYQDFHLVFEFMMPDSQKRLDVAVLSKGKVLSLEFKKKDQILKDDVAQAAGYGQSISHYHFATEEAEMKVAPYLVYTPGDPAGRHDLIPILHPGNFTDTLKNELSGETPMSDQECEAWVASPFHPLKNIAEATLQLFLDGDLPNIKSIREGDIKDTLEKINSVIDDPASRKSIMFVSGVPGSGKTLVGLKTVYDHARPGEALNPIYLSGNDPLVNILQNTLSTNHIDREGGSFIQQMKSFKKLAYGNTTPMNDIIVFDEAQRAWDIDYKEDDQTEATLLLRIGDRVADRYGKITIICLIGDGQAIHVHEETGMPIWADALAGRDDWNVYVPDSYAALFDQAPRHHIAPELMLDTSIRNDFIDVSPWVEAILDLDLEKAKRYYESMLRKGFKCWSFRQQRNLQGTVDYVQNNFPGSHTGIVVSSHLDHKEYFGPQYRGSYVASDNAYNWYMHEGPRLTRGASEFLIQGIELEYPIVSFVGDYYIENGHWVLDPHAQFKPEIRDREALIKNVYRVLLTRSRKGMFLYFPQDAKLDETYRWFQQMLNINGGS
ncbi:MAG: DUF2075 domain-containing protein [Lachnospiraceae bacterium]|jgi:8-oxo-dGTP diphosphatase|nr:DUF2075 domain-containing protein [Lachnospiraceae bacterium]MCH4067257.1 DUF2075 domain-containing protein [Lachnospiraceae bacterium]MCH4113282.1 DUF2075 domain-containing protein [Lachnospiraceae bacterium]